MFITEVYDCVLFRKMVKCMRFFIVIGKDKIYTYEQNGQYFEPQFLEGSETFSLNAGNINEDVNTYMDILANEKNLGTTAKLEFDVLESSNQVLNSLILGVLGERVGKYLSLNDTINKIIAKLSRDKKLMIDKYGINYEGFSYKKEGGKIKMGEFDLLAYTIHPKDVLELMNI